MKDTIEYINAKNNGRLYDDPNLMDALCEYLSSRLLELVEDPGFLPLDDSKRRSCIRNVAASFVDGYDTVADGQLDIAWETEAYMQLISSNMQDPRFCVADSIYAHPGCLEVSRKSFEDGMEEAIRILG
jgi:hypothetical protein